MSTGLAEHDMIQRYVRWFMSFMSNILRMIDDLSNLKYGVWNFSSPAISLDCVSFLLLLDKGHLSIYDFSKLFLFSFVFKQRRLN